MTVAIIVPVYGRADLLRQCVRSVRANTLVPYELVLSDDASPDAETIDLLDEYALDGITVLHNRGPHGFPPNVNQAVAQTESEYICLLNSDTKVCVGWLGALLDEMADPAVGIVGGKLIYPRGTPHANTIQHAGVARDKGGPFHIHRYARRDAPEVNVRREINCVTFACALIRRCLWEELDGLDEGFAGGQFEDVDFAYRSREEGWKVVYTPKCEVYHYEHGSGEPTSADPNRARLLQKWPDLPSDVHLFQDFGEEPLAAFMHYVRANAMAYVYQYPFKKHFAHCQRLAQMGFAELPPVEQDWAREYARQLKEVL